MAGTDCSRKIRYLLGSSNSSKGHRLGVNALRYKSTFFDSGQVFSGGRDGCIIQWNVSAKNPVGAINKGLADGTDHVVSPATRSMSYVNSVQAHSHWINDLAITNGGRNIISASSDLSIKIWCPDDPELRIVSIGEHLDYVRCLAAPKINENWVASAGLDGYAKLWDISGKGLIKEFESSVHQEASFYSLAFGGNCIAYAGTNNFVTVVDVRSGQTVAELVGHNQNIRGLLFSLEDRLIVSSSSDSTINYWSLGERRCLHTLACTEPAWTLFTEDEHLQTFYTGHKDGCIAYTEIGMDDGKYACKFTPLFRENSGIYSITGHKGEIWSSTHSSEWHRWVREPQNGHQSFTDLGKEHCRENHKPMIFEPSRERDIPLTSTSTRRIFGLPGLQNISNLSTIAETISRIPSETIHGQEGLVRFLFLNDRQRVLTENTNGEIELWNIILCDKTASFGNADLDKVYQKMNTLDFVPRWCSIDNKTGALMVTLDENTFYDGVIYGDRLQFKAQTIPQNNHVNLGELVLRNLFTGLLEEEMKRDSLFRKQLTDRFFQNSELNSIAYSTDEVSLLKSATNSETFDSICASTDMTSISLQTSANITPLASSSNLFKGVALAEINTHSLGPDPDSQFGSSMSNSGSMQNLDIQKSEIQANSVPGPHNPSRASPISSRFLEKIKYLGRVGRRKNSRSSSEREHSASLNDTMSESQFTDITRLDVSEVAQKEEKYAKCKALGDVISGIRQDYNGQTYKSALNVRKDLPQVQIPSKTTIIISEELRTAGDVRDIYRGTVQSAEGDADELELVAPAWLGYVLFQPEKLEVKPYKRLNMIVKPATNMHLMLLLSKPYLMSSSRMLRAEKVATSIKEKFNALYCIPYEQLSDWLVLTCNNHEIDYSMTVGAIRTYFWSTSSDLEIIFHIKQEYLCKITPRENPTSILDQTIPESDVEASNFENTETGIA